MRIRRSFATRSAIDGSGTRGVFGACFQARGQRSLHGTYAGKVSQRVQGLAALSPGRRQAVDEFLREASLEGTLAPDASARGGVAAGPAAAPAAGEVEIGAVGGA